MCHWKKWVWPGILTVAILSAFTLWMKTDDIQSDLKAKAESRLTEAGLNWTSVQVDGRDATVTGLAPSENSQIQAATLADEAYDIRVVENRTELMAAQSPYTLAVKRDANSVSLTGFVPDEPTRTSIVQGITDAIPNVQIDDRTELARGAPAGLVEMSTFAAAQLGGVTAGNYSISDTGLTVEGSAADRENYDRINAALAGTIPGGGELVASKITAPLLSPYTWSVQYEGDGITLSGHVPSNDVRKTVLDQAAAVLPDADVTDDMLIASGAPIDFTVATEFALQQMPRFQFGSATLSDLDLTLEGTARDPAAFQAARADATGTLPTGISLAALDIAPPSVSPYIWKAELDDGSELTLNGYVPSDEVRKKNLDQAAAALPDVTITDNQMIARGEPADFPVATEFALQQLPRFAKGSISLSGPEFKVEGQALNPQDYRDAIQTFSGKLPASFSLSSQSITPAIVSPYTWSAKHDRGAVVLEGYVPDETTRAAIADAVRQAISDARIDDKMQLAVGQPETFGAAARFAAAQLANLSPGHVALSDLGLTVEGVAISSDAYQGGKAAANGSLPAAMTLAAENIVAQTVTPYQWSAQYDGRQLLLSGSVPSEEVREGLLGAVREQLPEAEIADEMTIARGEPDTFETAANGAIELMARFSQGRISLSDLDLTVEGTAKSAADYPEAETYLADKLPGKINLVSSAIQPPLAEGDYVWSASKTGNRIILSGSAPNKDARNAIENETRNLYPNSDIENRMVVERGAPYNFRDAVNARLPLLVGFGEGSVELRNTTFRLRGTAKSVNEYEIALSDLAKEPGRGFSWGESNIIPATVSPYTWTLSRGDEMAMISGFVPSKKAGADFAAAVKTSLEKEVENRQRVASGTPEQFDVAVGALINAVAALENSRGSITGISVAVEGRAKSEADAEAIAESLRSALPQTYKLRQQISYPLPKPEPQPIVQTESEPEPVVEAEPQAEPETVAKAEPQTEPVAKPDVCPVDFAAFFQGDKVLFRTAKAIIREESYPLLDRIAEGAKQCPGARIEVGGHTDSRGTRRYNQGLSEARAQAVVDYMVKAGVTDAELVAKGYGETDPIRPNDLPENRAQNRRIEFRALQ